MHCHHRRRANELTVEYSKDPVADAARRLDVFFNTFSLLLNKPIDVSSTQKNVLYAKFQIIILNK